MKFNKELIRKTDTRNNKQNLIIYYMFAKGSYAYISIHRTFYSLQKVSKCGLFCRFKQYKKKPITKFKLITLQ